MVNLVAILANLLRRTASGSHVPKWQTFRDVLLKEENLYLVNISSSVLISAIGDLFIQWKFGNRRDGNRFDYSRTMRVALADGYTCGSLAHFVYRRLDKYYPEPTFTNVGRKLLVDQTLLTMSSLIAFYLTIGFMSAEGMKEIFEEMKLNLWMLYTAQVCICAPTQIINFWFIPSQYRLIYMNTLSLGAAMYTSYFKYR